MEERACGPANIDIKYLKEHTENEVSSIRDLIRYRELKKRWRICCGRYWSLSIKASLSSICSLFVVEANYLWIWADSSINTNLLHMVNRVTKRFRFPILGKERIVLLFIVSSRLICPDTHLSKSSGATYSSPSRFVALSTATETSSTMKSIDSFISQTISFNI